ncbi:MAG: hypothetical protein JO270_24180 [Acidobacteriaceae bacterium]|nr:hypothetical protein [Acidobacteriaceae bacterium]
MSEPVALLDTHPSHRLADALPLADRGGTNDDKYNKVFFGLQAWRVIIAIAFK